MGEGDVKTNFLLGYKVVATDRFGKFVQARRHKKKRINKKWLKRYGMKSVPDGDRIVVWDDMMTIFVHPVTWEKIRKQMEKEGYLKR